MQRTMQDTRFLLAAAGGGLISLGLFMLMQQLIGNRPPAAGAAAEPLHVGWVRVQRQHRVIRDPLVRPKPPKVVKRPPTGTQVTRVTHAPHVPAVLKLPGGEGNPTFMEPPGERGEAGTSALQVRFRTPPLYPTQAAYRGVEGNVTACFTVTAAGSVVDPYVVGASSPQARRMLAAAALSAVRQWKFFPRVVNGIAAATPRVCQVVHFRLDGR